MTATTYNEGYYEQSAYNEEVTPIATLKRFGYPVTNAPIVDIGVRESILERDVYGQYYKSLEEGPQRADLVSARFIPVNGEFLRWMLGKSSGTTTKTVTNMDGTQRKPFITVWKQVDGIKEHVYGTMFESMTLSMEQGKYPVVNMTGKGLSVGINTDTPSIAYLDDVSTRFDIMTGMTWDGDALTPYACTINLKQNVTPISSYDGTYQDITDQNAVYGTITVLCTASEGETAYADYIAKSAKTFTVSLGKSSAAHSIVGTFANARIMQMDRQENIGLPPIYTMLIAIQTSSFVVVDGT